MAKKEPTTTKKETTKKKVAIEAPEVVEQPKPAKTPKTAKAHKPSGTKAAAHKLATIKKFQQNANDTGSTGVQIAVLSEKINMLSKHVAEHKKDNDSRMGLLKMISQRRGLLSYLEKRQPEDYRKLLASLGLRK